MYLITVFTNEYDGKSVVRNICVNGGHKITINFSRHYLFLPHTKIKNYLRFPTQKKQNVYLPHALCVCGHET